MPAMLVTSRRQGEVLLIGDEIEVTIVHIGRTRVHVGIRAPRRYQVSPGEKVRGSSFPPADPAPRCPPKKIPAAIHVFSACTDESIDQQDAGSQKPEGLLPCFPFKPT
jgi:hypothetical protein